MTNPRILSLIIALLIPGFARVARADDSADYKALTEAAVEEHGLGHYEEARALFAKAHAIEPNARTLWGMGVAAFEARQYVDAIGLLEAARSDPRKPLTGAQRNRADSLIERSRNFVVRLPLQIEPRDAQVSIDGRVLQPDADGIVLLDAGPHQIVVSAPGYVEVSRSMRWSAGTADLLSLRLEPKVNASLAEQSRSARAPAGAPEQGQAQREEPSRALGALKWTSLGMTVASLGLMSAGIAMREAAVSKWNDDEKCPPYKEDSCPGAKRDAEKWKTVTIVSAASTGVFAVLTTVFFVLDRRAASRAEALTRCVPSLSPGLSCKFRF